MDDGGWKQRRKNFVAHTSEFQKVNNFRLGHVTHSNLASKIILLLKTNVLHKQKYRIANTEYVRHTHSSYDKKRKIR